MLPRERKQLCAGVFLSLFCILNDFLNPKKKKGSIESSESATESPSKCSRD
jgi:hypothetical protein